MTHRMIPIVCIAATLAACSSGPPPRGYARDVVSMPRVVPYDEYTTTEAIRRECSFPHRLPAAIAAEAADHGIQVQLVDDLDRTGGRVLYMKTVKAEAMGGGSYTGKKRARVRGELRENGRVVGDFEIQRHTGRGWTACATLERIADAMAGNIVKFLQNPQMGLRIEPDR